MPEVHRKSPDELHTASDGQKVLSQKKSLNATFSYKYPGYTKAAVVNTAIDERFAIFSSAVITTAEPEAISMVDLLLGNPVVKSTIHSTNTHGSTEVIFGIMQLLGVYFGVHQKVWGKCFLMSLIKALGSSIGYLKIIRLKYKCHCPTLFDGL